MSQEFVGGCHCGALRYRSSVKPVESGYCHCRDCQLLSGAPAVAWASFPVESFEYTTGTPKIYKSSEYGQREFCDNCGTEICFRDSREMKTVDISAATLDEPERITVEMHTFERSRIRWFEIADDLPRYETQRDARDKN